MRRIAHEAGRLLPLATVLLIAAAAHADTIRLKGSVRLARGQTEIHLSDIANLEGPEAERYAKLVVGSIGDTFEPVELSVQDVRQRLTEASVHWGHVSLSGRQVVVRPRGEASAQPPLAMQGASLDPPVRRGPDREHADVLASTVLAAATLRGAITRSVLEQLRRRPDHVRLLFDPRDEAFLRTSTETTRFEIDPIGSNRSDRIQLTVRTWADGRVAARRSLAIGVRVLVSTGVLRRDIERHEMIDADDLNAKQAWLPPSQAMLIAPPAEAAGQMAQRRLKAGEFVRAKDLRRQILIERGDLVMVRCPVGGHVISIQAEAREDGAAGQTIEFRKVGERESFTAEVAGPGEAVLHLSP